MSLETLHSRLAQRLLVADADWHAPHGTDDDGLSVPHAEHLAAAVLAEIAATTGTEYGVRLAGSAVARVSGRATGPHARIRTVHYGPWKPTDTEGDTK